MYLFNHPSFFCLLQHRLSRNHNYQLRRSYSKWRSCFWFWWKMDHFYCNGGLLVSFILKISYSIIYTIYHFNFFLFYYYCKKTVESHNSPFTFEWNVNILIQLDVIGIYKKNLWFYYKEWTIRTITCVRLMLLLSVLKWNKLVSSRCAIIDTFQIGDIFFWFLSSGFLWSAKECISFSYIFAISYSWTATTSSCLEMWGSRYSLCQWVRFSYLQCFQILANL